MKKIILCIVLFFSFSSVLVASADAKLKDSPKTGYNLFFGSKTAVYNKPNGKKITTPPMSFGKFGEPGEPNYVKVIKFSNGGWVKVKYTTKNVKKNGHLLLNKTGYMKTNNLRASAQDGTRAFVKSSNVKLYAKPSTSSKAIKKIALGTRVEINFKGAFDHANFIKVNYVKSGKKYTGYVKTSNLKYI